MQERFKSSGDELVTAIYQAAAKIIPASRPLELLAEQTRSNKIFAAWFNLDRRQGAITASFNMEPNYIENYREFHAGENPFFTHTSHFQAEGLVWRGCDILDPEKLKATEFYKLFMTSQAMLNTAHLVIRVRGPDIFHIVLTRRPEAEDFEDAALETCKLFAMHARRALDISSAAEGWSALNRGFATAIDELSAGVAVVELPTTIRYVNGTFDTLLNGRRDAAAGGQSSAYWSGRGPLVRRLPRPILDALAMRPVPKSLVIHSGVDEGKRPVFIDIQPYHSHSDFDGQTISGYVILCRSADTEIEVDESALKAAYFLTTAEARVAAALVAGENVMAVAARLGISPETVRTHIKHILEKTYTTRQAELMKLLMSVSLRKTTPTPTPSPERPDVIAELMKAIRRTPGAESST